MGVFKAASDRFGLTWTVVTGDGADEPNRSLGPADK